MRRSASEIIHNLEMRIARLEGTLNRRPAKKDDEAVAKAIAKAVAPSFEESLGLPAFETPQVDTNEDTGLIEVSQRMLFRLSEAQFGSRLRETKAYHRSFGRLPRSKAFKKTLAQAILNEAHDKRIAINSLAQKSLKVNYRQLAEGYTFTGEVSFYDDHLEVEEVSLRGGNFSITILYKQCFRPD